MKKRKVRTFNIPKFMYDEAVKPEDVLNLRAFGSNQIASLSALLNNKLQTARNKHDITLEYMRSKALAGTVIDGAGTTLYNYFTEFEITQHTVDFVLGTSTTDILGKVMDLKRWIEQHLLGRHHEQRARAVLGHVLRCVHRTTRTSRRRLPTGRPHRTASAATTATASRSAG
jgi:hypothetical protein